MGAVPDLNIYHYAPYEPAALKRLMGRYATREEETAQRRKRLRIAEWAGRMVKSK